MFILDELANANEFCTGSVLNIFNLVGKIVFILKIAIPIIIVILATLDLGKAVMAGEEKAIKEAQNMLIKRLIYGVAIFFVVTIVQVVFGLVNQSVGNNNCWQRVTSLNPWSDPWEQ